MKSDASRSGVGQVIAASCFVMGLVALLGWRLGVWQCSATPSIPVDADPNVAHTALAPSTPAREAWLSEESRGSAPPRAEPAVWHAPSEGPVRRATETRKPQDTVRPDDLDALVVTDPERALALAREALTSDPGGELAPRYARSLVKALSSLGRFHEARGEARHMVERYRGTSEARDVEHHLLVYPLDQPSREQMQADASRGVLR